MKGMILTAMMALLVLPPSMLCADSSGPPALPKAEDINATPDTSVDSNSDTNTAVDTPQGEPDVKKESVTVVNEKPARFQWGNFILGALGGAVLVAGVGIGIGAASNNTGSFDSSKIGILAAGGAVVGGLLSFLLGATTPPAATPPDMKTELPTQPSLGSADMLVFKVQF
jgi:hypothetical protein